MANVTLVSVSPLYRVPVVNAVPANVNVWPYWDVVFRTAVGNVLYLSLANAPAAGVFPCLLMNPSRD